VPLVISGPGAPQKGHVSKTPVSLIDIVPTILDIVGVPESDRLDMDGESLMPLLNGKEEPNRAVYSEMHSEGVYTTCFMVRKGKFKYIYIHKHDEQLFDLEKDPEEWDNLAKNAEYASIRDELKTGILNQFDPDRIEKELRDSLQRRQLLKKAMQKTGRDWAYQPEKRL
jgi:choline-sulfatase